jgi:hypothetical protein
MSSFPNLGLILTAIERTLVKVDSQTYPRTRYRWAGGHVGPSGPLFRGEFERCQVTTSELQP